LRKDDRKFFVELVNSHYQNAFSRFPKLNLLVADIAVKLRQQLNAFTKWAKKQNPDKETKELLDKEQFLEKLKTLDITDIEPVMDQLKKATVTFEDYNKKLKPENIEATNTTQKELLKQTEIFLQDYSNLKKELEKTYREYEKLYKLAEDNLNTKEDKTWKELNKPKEIRQLLDLLNEYSNAHKNNNYIEEETCPVYFIKMAEWLQQRFPKVEYEDVTGLCKLATIVDIEEQDYSLNPGRYVGVVIEEDGLTEEEFQEMISNYHLQLGELNRKNLKFENIISKSFKQLLQNENS